MAETVRIAPDVLTKSAAGLSAATGLRPADAEVIGQDLVAVLAARLAVAEAVRLAENSGIGMVGVRRSTHFGMSALYAQQALDAGYTTGANYGGAVKSLYFDHSEPQNVGHMVIAIKPDLFMKRPEFKARMDNFVARAKAVPHAQGFDEILIPGEPESRRAASGRREGVSVTPEVLADLQAEADRLGVLHLAATSS